MNNSIKRSILLLSGFAALSMGACAFSEMTREEVADRVAHPAWMLERPVQAGPFSLTAYERMHERGEPATVYIEGSGEAEFIKSGTYIKAGALFDPTPSNPVALHLAAMDKSTNLAYLARPCQYTGLNDPEGDCETYWGAAQYSPEIISAYNDVLDGIKRRYGVTTFQLVGYDTGATLAALLAGKRKDVTSLRTVAGRFNLDALHSTLPALRAMPQHHFTGGQDEIAPPAGMHAYLQALGNTDCAEHTLIQEAEHEKGWVNKWPELLKKKAPLCYVAPEPEFIPIEKPEPIYVPHIGSSKK